jgi:hypothetical protein
MAQVLGSNSSSSGTSGSQNTSNSALDPEIKALFMNNVNRATGVANNLQAQTFAPRTGDYNVGQGMIRTTANPNSAGFGSINAAAGLTNQNANTSSVANINQYLNPYTDYVAGNTLDQLGRANQIALNSVSGDATTKGAFGGSRHGIAEAETNSNFFNTTGNTLGNLYNTAYTNAVGQSSADQNRYLNAANQLNTIGTNQQTQGYLAGQNNMNLGLGDQEYTQRILDATRNLPLEQQAVINQALGINPGGGSGIVSTAQGTSQSQQSSKSGSGLMGFGSFF